jgi:hypothetical protein
VPFVQKIPQRQIIQNCDVPEPPEPIFDCSEAPLEIPPPVVSTSIPCPTIQTEVNADGADFDVVVTQEQVDPCVLKFTYDLVVTGGGGGGGNLCATADIICTTGPCSVQVQVVDIVTPQHCQTQFQFHFQIPQGQQGPQGPQGSKFAIIAVRSDDGDDQYLGLFCTEMPESYFMDIIDLKIQAYQTTMPMDRTFVKACESNSFRVVSAVTPDPAKIGVHIDDNKVVLRTQDYSDVDSATVTVAGIRKGFGGRRFPAFTVDQKNQNEKFWGSAFDPPAE